jgi:hypothetical protein
MNKRQTFCQPIAAASPLKNPQAIKDTEDETNKTNAQPESFELKATSNNRDFGVRLAFCGHGGQECR